MSNYPTNLTERQWQVIKNIVDPQEKSKKTSLRDTALSFKKAWKFQKHCYFIANTSMVSMAFISPFLTMPDGIHGG